MTTYTPEQADRILRRLAGTLEDRAKRAELSQAYAGEIRTIAVARAGSRPTPQAPMVAGALTVRGDAVLAPAGAYAMSSSGPVRVGDIAFGAEYGSDTYTQFGPRRSSGYFLGPATEEVDDSAGDRWLDSAMDDAFRRFGG